MQHINVKKPPLALPGANKMSNTMGRSRSNSHKLMSESPKNFCATPEKSDYKYFEEIFNKEN